MRRVSRNMYILCHGKSFPTKESFAENQNNCESQNQFAVPIQI